MISGWFLSMPCQIVHVVVVGAYVGEWLRPIILTYHSHGRMYASRHPRGCTHWVPGECSRTVTRFPRCAIQLSRACNDHKHDDNPCMIPRSPRPSALALWNSFISSSSSRGSSVSTLHRRHGEPVIGVSHAGHHCIEICKRYMI